MVKVVGFNIGFHPLKSGRDLRRVEVIARALHGFHPLKSGRDGHQAYLVLSSDPGFHPLKSGRDNTVVLKVNANINVSIPSSRVGTVQISEIVAELQRFHPLKSGRDLMTAERPSRIARGFHPLKSGRDLVKGFVKGFVKSCFHPLKSGRDRGVCSFHLICVCLVSIPSSRVGTFRSCMKPCYRCWFPSPQVGSGPSQSHCQSSSRFWFPSPQVGSGRGPS